MFESLVSSLLTRFLGDYIENLNTDQLNISIWSGDVVLTNLEIKGNALASLNLPVCVKRGVIGLLKLAVPWKNLSSKPVDVQIEDVYLVCGPQTAVVYDPVKAEKDKLAAKAAQLKKHEELRAAQKAAAEGGGDQSTGFAGKLVQKVIDNLQVKISRIHVRYEATSEDDPERTYALGATLEGLSLLSTDDKWSPKFVDNFTSMLRNKLVDLSSLAIYVDVDSPALAALPTDKLCVEMRRLIATRKTTPSSAELNRKSVAPIAKNPVSKGVYEPLRGKYVLVPLSAEMKTVLDMNPAPKDMSIPKIDAKLDIPAVSLEVSQDQYRTLMETLDSMGKHAQELKYIEYRPLNTPVQENPRAWFKYAACVIRDGVKREGLKKDPKTVMKKLKQRNRYVDLYKRNQGLGWLEPLTKNEKAEMERIEQEAEFEDIVFYRSVADKIVEQEAKNKEKRDEFIKAKKAQSKSGGWFSGWFGGGKKEEPKEKKEDEKPEPEIKLSEEQMQEIYNIVGYSGSEVTLENPPEYMVVRAKLHIGLISAALKDYRKDGRGKDKNLLYTALEGIDVGFIKRPENVQLSLDVHSFFADDNATPDTKFPKMICLSKSEAKEEEPDEFMSLKFELAPLDKHADLVVKLFVCSVDVVVTKPAIDSLAGFFAPSEIAAKKAAAVSPGSSSSESTMQTTVWNSMAVSRGQLERAMMEHKSMDIDVCVKAPCIIVPERASDPSSTVIVLDLGMLEVKSELSKTEVSDDGIAQVSEENLYDHYKLNITNIMVVMAALTPETLNTRPWRVREEAAKLPVCQRIIEEFNFGIHLLMSIKPQALTLTSMIVNVEMPSLSLRIPIMLYDRLMSFINTFVPPQEHDMEVVDDKKDKIEGKPEEQKKEGEEGEGEKEGVIDEEASTMDFNKILNTHANQDLLEIEEESEDPYSAESMQKRTLEEQKKLTELLKTHKKVEAHALIECVSVTIVDADEEGKDRNILRIVVGNVAADVAIKTWDMEATATLGEISIEDCVAKEMGLKVPYLATSYAVSQDKDLQAKEDKLLTVSFAKHERNTPSYEKLDMCLEANFHQFYLVLNQQSVAEIIRILLTFKAKMDAQAEQNSAAKMIEQKKEADASAAAASAAPGKTQPTEQKKTGRKLRPGMFKRPEIVKTKVIANLDSVGVILMGEESHFAEFRIEGMKADIALKERTMVLEASLKNICLVDCQAVVGKSVSGEDVIGARNVITTKDSSSNMLDAKVQTHSYYEEGFGGYDTEVKAIVRSLDIFPVFGFLLSIKDYFVNGAIMAALADAKDIKKAIADSYNSTVNSVSESVSAAAASVGEKVQQQLLADAEAAKGTEENAVVSVSEDDDKGSSTTSPSKEVESAEEESEPEHKSRIYLDVVVQAPRISIPLDYTSPDMVILNLGQLSVQTESVTIEGEGVDKMKIGVNEMSLETCIDKRVMPIIHPIDINVSFGQSTDAKPKVVAQTEIILNMNPLRIAITAEQINFVLRFAQEFLKKVQEATIASEKAAAEAKKKRQGDVEELKEIEDDEEENEDDVIVEKKDESDDNKKPVEKKKALKEKDVLDVELDEKEEVEEAPFITAVEAREFLKRPVAIKGAKLMAMVHMGGICLDIYANSGESEDDILASIGLYDIDVKASISTEEFIRASVSVDNIEFIDKRVNSSAVYKGVIGVTPDEEGNRRLLAVDFGREGATGDMAVNVKMSQLQVRVLPSIICDVKNFFLVPMGKMQKSLEKHAAVMAMAKPDSREKKLRRLARHLRRYIRNGLYETENKKTDEKDTRTNRNMRRVLRISGQTLLKWIMTQSLGKNDRETSVQVAQDLLRMNLIVNEDPAKREEPFDPSERSVYCANPRVLNAVKQLEGRSAAEDGEADKEDAKKKSIVPKKMPPIDRRRQPCIAADIEIVDPEISIVEDETSLHTNCACLTLRVICHYFHDCRGYDNAVLSVSNLAFTIVPLSRGFKNPLGRSFNILTPFEINVCYFATARKSLLDGSVVDGTQDITVSMPSIKLAFSYQTLKLALAIFDTLKPLGATPEPEEEDISSSALAASTISDDKKMSQQEIEQMVQESAEEKKDDAKANGEETKSVIIQKLSLSIQSVIVTVINDFRGRSVPLLELALREIAVSAEDWSNNLGASVSASLSSDFFNENIMLVEPLIERWDFGVSIKMNKNKEEDGKPVPGLGIGFFASTPFSVNVSHSFMSSVARTIASLSDDFFAKQNEKDENEGEDLVESGLASSIIRLTESGISESHSTVPMAERDASSFHGSYIVNKMGIPAKGTIQFVGALAPKDREEHLDLATGEKVAVSLGDYNSSKSTSVNSYSRVCDVYVGASKLDNVEVDRVGFRAFSLGDVSALQIAALSMPAGAADDKSKAVKDEEEILREKEEEEMRAAEEEKKETKEERKARMKREKEERERKAREKKQKEKEEREKKYMERKAREKREKERKEEAKKTKKVEKACDFVVAETVWDKDGTKLTVLRSPIMLINKTKIPLRIYLNPTEENPRKDLGECTFDIMPGEKEPVPIVYMRHAKITIACLTKDTLVPFTGISSSCIATFEGNHNKMMEETVIMDYDLKGTKQQEYISAEVKCDSQTLDRYGYVLNTVTFMPPVSFFNSLPYDLTFILAPNGVEAESQHIELKSGSGTEMFNIDPMKNIKVTVVGLPGDYSTESLSHMFEFDQSLKPRTELWTLKSKKFSDLNLSVDLKMEPVRKFVVYAPYWLLNKTGLPLFFHRNHNANDIIAGPVVQEAPIMSSDGKISIRTKSGILSEAFSFEAIGTSGVAEFIDNEAGVLYSLKVSCYLGEGAFVHTKMVTFSPAHVLVNQMEDNVVLLSQADNKAQDKLVRVEPLSEVPFYWPLPDPQCKEIPKVVRRASATVVPVVAADDIEKSRYAPSGSFLLDDAGSNTLQLFDRQSREQNGVVKERENMYLAYDIVDSFYTTYILFRASGKKLAPYRVQNDTPYPFVACQKEAKSGKQFYVAPYSCEGFGWDEPMMLQELTITSPSSDLIWGKENRRVYEVNKLNSFKKIKTKTGKDILVYTKAEGSCRVLVFTIDNELYLEDNNSKFDEKSAESTAEEQEEEEKNKTKKGKKKSKKEEEDDDDDDSNQRQINMQLDLNLPSFGVSLITSEPREFLLFTLTEIRSSIVITDSDIEIAAGIGGIQLDNMLPDSECPVVLCGKSLDEKRKWLSVSIVMNTLYTGINYFEYFSLLLQEITVNFDTSIISPLLKFLGEIPDFSGAKNKEEEDSEEEYTTPGGDEDEEKKGSEDDGAGSTTQEKKEEKKIVSRWEDKTENIVNQRDVKTKMIYFHVFMLNAIKISLTFTSTPGFLDMLPVNPFTVLLKTIVGAVANLDAAPLKFNTLFLENPFVSQSELIGMLKKHYIRQGIQNVHMIIGSTEALGNPVGLFNNISTGVMDFFMEPAQGIVQSPQAFAKGLAKGSASLLKNSVYGAFNSVSKITGAIGKGIATLSCDDAYIAKRQANLRRKPKHAGEGAAEGLKALGMGLFDGVTGIVLKPVQGARQEGMIGLLKGLGQGLVGVAVKPVAGAFEAISQTSAGIKNTTTYLDGSSEVHTVHPAPRMFNRQGQLLEYNEHECIGEMLMMRFPETKKDTYVFHADNVHSKKGTLLVTNRHLAIIEDYGKELEAVLPLSEIENFYQIDGGIALVHKSPDRNKIGSKKVQSFKSLIGIPDPNIATVVYCKLCHSFMMFEDQE